MKKALPVPVLSGQSDPRLLKQTPVEVRHHRQTKHRKRKRRTAVPEHLTAHRSNLRHCGFERRIFQQGIQRHEETFLHHCRKHVLIHENQSRLSLYPLLEKIKVLRIVLVGAEIETDKFIRRPPQELPHILMKTVKPAVRDDLPPNVRSHITAASVLPDNQPLFFQKSVRPQNGRQIHSALFRKMAHGRQWGSRLQIAGKNPLLQFHSKTFRRRKPCSISSHAPSSFTGRVLPKEQYHNSSEIQGKRYEKIKQ